MSKKFYSFVKFFFFFPQLYSLLQMKPKKGEKEREREREETNCFTQPNIAVFEGAIFPTWLTWHRENEEHKVFLFVKALGGTQAQTPETPQASVKSLYLFQH